MAVGMPPVNVEPFRGDGSANENPQDFIRAILRAMGDKGEAFKLEQFPLYLKAGSEAETGM